MANPNAEAAEAASHSADVRLSDISASTYKKSVVFATSDKSKRATQLEAHRMTVPTVQSAHMSSYAAGDNACTKSATEVEYLWLPSLKSEDKRRSRVEKYTHMEFTRNDNIYRLYTPRGAILIFLLLGTLLLMFAVALLCSSRHSFTQEIEYTDYGSEPITFKIEQDVKGPVYFGYKVSDFYVNHKRVAYESVPFRVTGAKCKMFDTFEKILDLRCIDNKNTLNGIDEWCAVKNTEPAFKLPAYPCGAISATIMTDNFAICRSSVQSVPATAKTGVDVEGCLPLSMKIPEDDYGFFHINVGFTAAFFHLPAESCIGDRGWVLVVRLFELLLQVVGQNALRFLLRKALRRVQRYAGGRRIQAVCHQQFVAGQVVASEEVRRRNQARVSRNVFPNLRDYGLGDGGGLPYQRICHTPASHAELHVRRLTVAGHPSFGHDAGEHHVSARENLQKRRA
ncbi:DNA-directed RNA polymerase II subunit rpb1 [Babesia caballi]|uniref:DNA-directed RNA polymerase II subunit rpb1 n=1 Tax=Babesia caballi TaxID=5871 RepID=A0AAV4LVX4_BABCB|nr:DNA-directed RNA polymerase II subunit rpb1 [Babesia caballi]